MSRTEKLRRLAKRCQVEHGRLNKLADAVRAANLPMVARDVQRMATVTGSLALSLDYLAGKVRDPRGSRSNSRAEP